MFTKDTRRLKRRRFKMRTEEFVNTGEGPRPNDPADETKAKLFGIFNSEPLSRSRKEVLKRLRKMLEEIPVNKHIAFANSNYYKLFLVYTKSYAFFIECYPEIKQVRKSIHFSSSRLAILAHKNKRITWVEELSTFPPELSNSGPPPK